MVAVTRFEKFTQPCLHIAARWLRRDNARQPAPRQRVAGDVVHRGREAGSLRQRQRGVQRVDSEPVLVAAAPGPRGGYLPVPPPCPPPPGPPGAAPPAVLRRP